MVGRHDRNVNDAAGAPVLSVPADAAAWSRWYDEHGAEKMTEFERLEWWQVRGDE